MASEILLASHKCLFHHSRPLKIQEQTIYDILLYDVKRFFKGLKGFAHFITQTAVLQELLQIVEKLTITTFLTKSFINIQIFLFQCDLYKSLKSLSLVFFLQVGGMIRHHKVQRYTWRAVSQTAVTDATSILLFPIRMPSDITK